MYVYKIYITLWYVYITLCLTLTRRPRSSMFMLLRCEVMRRLPALGQKCHFQLVLMHLTIILGRSQGALTTRVCLWADADLAPGAALRFRPNPFVLSRLSPFHGCVFTAGDRLCLGCATGDRSRSCPSAWLLLPAHPRFPPGRAAAGSGAPSGGQEPRRLGARAGRGGRGTAACPAGRVHCPGESRGWEAGNHGAAVAREHPRGRRLLFSAPPRPAAAEPGRQCVGARDGWVLFSPVFPLAGRWCGPGSGLRRGGVRRCQCREVQPSAGFDSHPTNTAMEPHRWLPLEANPDVSARLGGWVWREGGRMAEGRGLGAAPGSASRAEGWLVGAGSGGALSLRVWLGS